MKIISKMIATIMENILIQLESSNCNIYIYIYILKRRLNNYGKYFDTIGIK